MAVLAGLIFSLAAMAQSSKYFTIRFVDDQTGRVVPMVELTTTNDIRYYTDSNGIVAFYEPGLMDQTVYFNIKSDGYEFPEDFLSSRGVALKVTGGGSAELKIRRTSIAERLYRVTGEGIYRYSVLVGAPVPIKQPVLNGQVMGQDGGLGIPWRGKIYWFWGDTSRPSYPLGNFAISAATSEWPDEGGLSPDTGIDLSYFVDESGFSRPMLPSADFPGPGPKCIGGLKIVPDESGSENDWWRTICGSETAARQMNADWRSSTTKPRAFSVSSSSVCTIRCPPPARPDIQCASSPRESTITTRATSRRFSVA
jgi:hypothetical protein